MHTMDKWLQASLRHLFILRACSIIKLSDFYDLNYFSFLLLVLSLINEKYQTQETVPSHFQTP